MKRPASAKVITSTSDDGLIFAGPCVIERVAIGVAEASDTISIYDDAGGNTNNLVATISTANVGSVDLGVYLRRGLTAITTASAAAITVVWS